MQLSNRLHILDCGLGSLRLGIRLQVTVWAGVLIALGSSLLSQAQIPTALTDKIYQGSGTIDLLKDVSAAELQTYLEEGGGALIGVDVNENLSGNETSDSVGIAIKSLELVITTTTGTMTFSDFYTSTTALILEDGASAPQEFYTLFGSGGSSSINGGTTDFDASKMDDVLEIRNVAVTGTLLGAELNVTFLDTARTGAQGNETFFDFSNGPEDFALINQESAAVIEAAAAGLADAPENVSYTEQAPVAAPAPGAPSPPLSALLILAGLVSWRYYHRG